MKFKAVFLRHRFVVNKNEKINKKKKKKKKNEKKFSFK